MNALGRQDLEQSCNNYCTMLQSVQNHIHVVY